MIDVAVVGGGPAGIAACIHLRKAGLTVLQFDPADHRDDTYAAAQTVGRSTIEQLCNLGLETSLLADFARLPNVVRVDWSEEIPGSTDIFAAMPRSLVIDQSILRRALMAIAEREGVVRRQSNPGSLRLQRHNDWWEIDNDQHAARAKIIVDATGRKASLIRRHGAKLIMLDALAAWTVIVPCAATDTTVNVAAERDGWRFECTCAGKLHITFVGDQDSEQDQGLGLPVSLLSHCRRRGIDAVASKRAAQKTSAAVSYLDRAVVPAMLAIGDAAMSLDPLSAGGIARALHSAERAANAVTSALDGDLRQLAEYEKSRRRAVAEHVSQRSEFYGTCRFSSEPFWRKRSASVLH